MHNLQTAAQSEKQKSSTLNNINSNDKILNIPVVNHSKYRLPEYQSPDASGLDLQANIESSINLHPQDRVTISTGILIQIPKGFEAQIRLRSILAKNHGITIVNSPGIIDADY